MMLVDKNLQRQRESMELQIVLIYCICDERLKSIQRVKNWCSVRISDAEVMTTVIVAMRYYNGNVESARKFYPSMVTLKTC